MQQYSISQIIKPKALLISGIAAVLAYGIISYPSPTMAMSNSDIKISDASQRYIADIDPLNKSNADGTAEFVKKGKQLTVTINANGLEPGLHPQHIHGQEKANAECPTDGDDINNDGFISVLEGAPAYGPIKLNLTSPQTAFGTPPTPALFAPFAGTADNNNFPTAGADGKLHFVQTYTFDNSDVAQAAFKSLTPLKDQHFVLHGGTAPLGVDADAFAALGAPRPEGFNPNGRSYDVLLPVGCGQIDKVIGAPLPNEPVNNSAQKADQLSDETTSAQAQLYQSSGATIHQLDNSDSSQSVQASTIVFTNLSNQLTADFDSLTANAVSSYQANIANDMNVDEARNQLIDQLNKHGNVQQRDSFLNDFDKSIDHYSNAIEKAKNQL